MNISSNLAAFLVGAVFVANASAAGVTRTPDLTEGPFYPFNSSNSLPPLTERDPDLTRVKDATARASGTRLMLSGVVRDLAGKPLDGVTVEIWQTDADGAYYHSGDRSKSRDRNFQFFGESVTDAGGRYSFRTVVPGLYTGRVGHIHFKVKRGTSTLLTSQFVFEDQRAEFARDGVTSRLPASELETIVLAPVKSTDAAEEGTLVATKDIHLDPAATPSRSRDAGKRREKAR